MIKTYSHGYFIKTNVDRSLKKGTRNFINRKDYTTIKILSKASHDERRKTIKLWSRLKIQSS